MTTETTCLSSIWETDEETKGFYAAQQRAEDYAPLHPADTAYYDQMITIDLGKVESMIALPFHPSNAWTIHEFLDNAQELLAKVEVDAAKRFPKARPHFTDKIHDGGVWADQGVIAGCSGGLFANICYEFATKRLGVAVKYATITPNKQRMEEYPQLTEMWKSPTAPFVPFWTALCSVRPSSLTASIPW